MGKWLYSRGVPDPGLAGRSLRWAFDPWPPSPWVKAAAWYLGRDVRHVDMYGFQREIIAATQPVEGCLLAYVESRARQNRGGSVEVAFYLLIRDLDRSVCGTELESYNPFFGCEVGYLEWCGEWVVLIYREKHRTYVCRVGMGGPATFAAIGNTWKVEGEVITHRSEEGATVRRLTLPGLNELPPSSSGEVIGV